VVKLLLDTGKVDANFKDQQNRTLLSLSTVKGHDSVTKLILAAENVGPDSKDETGRRTPFSWAAENGHNDVVKTLLNTGRVDPDSKDKYSWTPQMRAGTNGHAGTVKLLHDWRSQERT
jgi:ankyrin repeat protein